MSDASSFVASTQKILIVELANCKGLARYLSLVNKEIRFTLHSGEMEMSSKEKNVN